MLERFFRIVDRVGPNPQFFRALAVLLGVGFVMAKMPWVNRVVGQSIGIADLRHSVIFEQVADERKGVLIVRAVNVGQKKAENVVVSIRGKSQENEFRDLNIDSDEIYKVVSSDLARQEIIIQLSRLAPGAEIACRVDGWFNRPESIKVSVVSDQGKSLSMDLPALNAQIHKYTQALEDLYARTFSLLRGKLTPLFYEMQIREYLREHIGGFSAVERELLGKDFRTFFTAWLVVSLIIGLFFPRLIMLIPFAFASIFLFLSSKVAVGFIFVPFSLTVIIHSLVTSGACISENSKGSPWCLGLGIILVGVASLPLIAMKAPLVSAKFLFIPAFYIATLLLAVISYIVPSSEQSLSSDMLRPPFEQNLTVYSKLDLENLKPLDNKIQTIVDYLEYFGKKLRSQDIRIQRLQVEVAHLHQLLSISEEEQDGSS